MNETLKHIDKDAAEFFSIFDRLTDRSALFYGYLTGHFNGDNPNKSPVTAKKIAAVFECGMGCLTRHFSSNFSQVIGIIPPSTLTLAFAATPQELVSAEKVTHLSEITNDAIGSCDFVAAVNVHNHHHSYAKLSGFFKTIAKLLKPGGRTALIGSPSDFVHLTPDHYQNCIHCNDIPEEVVKWSTSLNILADQDGYVALGNLLHFPLADGTQKKVFFFMPHAKGPTKTITLKDTFWKDETLIRAAKEAGLEHVGKDILTWTDPVTGADHPNAYMGLRFRKPVPERPPSL